MNNNNIITRFPPSPTGWFHVGNARTALFNYFFTKQNGGTLLFRLEDTDRERSRDEYAQDIIAGLMWLGIEMDYTHPYKQSEHTAVYKKYLEQLIAEDKAYISKEEVKEEGQRAEVIRLRNPGKKITFTDLIRGEVTVDTTELGDFVIAKSVDEPIYHLAVVVDDFEMGVTHVLRGEDGIYNAPRQILIQEAIGAPRPVYAHLPFILNTDRSKLSKRNQGESVSLKYYREKGFLPEAMVNFLAFIGWNPGGEEEIFSLNELVEKFDITKVQKGGAVFNIEKLLWLNKEYLKRLPQEIAFAEIVKWTPEQYKNEAILTKLQSIILDRISVWSDIPVLFAAGEFDYAYAEPNIVADALVWKKGGTKDEAKIHLTEVKNRLSVLDDFSLASVQGSVFPYAEEKGKGNVLWPLRVALSGKEKSPDPFTLLSVLGKEVSLTRIDAAIRSL